MFTKTVDGNSSQLHKMPSVEIHGYPWPGLPHRPIIPTLHPDSPSMPPKWACSCVYMHVYVHAEVARERDPPIPPAHADCPPPIPTSHPYLDSYGLPLVSVNFHGYPSCPWKSMDSHGYAYISMAIHTWMIPTWIPMGVRWYLVVVAICVRWYL